MASPVNLPSGSISASTSSARTAYPKNASKNHVYVYNTGAVPIFVKSGDANVVATTSDNFVVAGQGRLFSKTPTDTHLAAITASSTSTVYFSEADAD